MTSGRNVTVTLTKTVKPANWLRAKRFQVWRWTAETPRNLVRGAVVAR